MERSDSIQDKLKDLRVGQRGGPRYTLEELSAATGISKSALGKYESDDCTDISPYNLAILARFYGVSVDYLLGLTEQKNHSGAAIEELHLSDAMLELLKSGKINNHLLCEMAMHPDFQRLMVDIEIYVDRIADMRIRDMNTYLDATREMLLHAALQCAGREIPCGLLTGVWIMHFSTITSSFKPYDLPLAVPGTFGIIEKTEQPLQGRFTAEEKEPIYVYCGAGAEPE